MPTLHNQPIMLRCVYCGGLATHDAQLSRIPVKENIETQSKY